MYDKKRVFITGHTGIKGSWLTALLLEMGAVVKGYSDDVHFHYNLLGLDHESVIADVLDKDRLNKEICNFEPDIIFHLAAQALVSVGHNDPYNTFKTNSLGTLNLLESCRSSSFSGPIVCVTTDKVYFNKEQPIGYKESDVLWGNDSYSGSKVCAEQIIDVYRRFYLNSLSAVRAGNIICGGETSKDRLLTDLVKAHVNGSTVTLRKPDAVRPFQHVLDCVYGYLCLGHRMLNNKEFAGNWNFAVEGGGISVLDFVTEFSKHIPIKYEVVKSDMEESNLLYLDTGKTSKLLGYSPLYDIKKSIKLTCEWYNKYYNNGEIITFEQIDDYLSERD